MKIGWFNKRIIYNDLLAIALACIVSLLFTQGQSQFTAGNKRNHQYHSSFINSGKIVQLSCSAANDQPPASDNGMHYLIVRASNTVHYRPSKPTVVREIVQNDNQKSIAKNLYSCSLPQFLNLSIPIAYRKLVI
jgi:hypothetical protein